MNRRVCLSLGGTTLWSSAHSYVIACNRRLNVPDPPAVLGQSVHAVSVWRDVSRILQPSSSALPSSPCMFDQLPHPLQFWWFWCHDDNAADSQCPIHLDTYQQVGPVGEFQLIAPTQALSHVSETQYQRIHLLFRDCGYSSLPTIVMP